MQLDRSFGEGQDTTKEHLLSGENANHELSFKFRQAAFAARPFLFSVVCTAYGGLPFFGGPFRGISSAG